MSAVTSQYIKALFAPKTHTIIDVIGLSEKDDMTILHSGDRCIMHARDKKGERVTIIVTAGNS